MSTPSAHALNDTDDQIPVPSEPSKTLTLGVRDLTLALPLPHITSIPWLHPTTTKNNNQPCAESSKILATIVGDRADGFPLAVVGATHQPLPAVGALSEQRSAIHAFLGIPNSAGTGSAGKKITEHNQMASTVHAALLPAVLLDHILFAVDGTVTQPHRLVKRQLERPVGNKRLNIVPPFLSLPLTLNHLQALQSYSTLHAIVKKIQEVEDNLKNERPALSSKSRAPQAPAEKAEEVADPKVREVLDHLRTNSQGTRGPGLTRPRNLSSVAFLLSFYLRVPL